MPVPTPNQIHLSSEHLGIARIDPNPPGCIDLVNDLLQKNHDAFGMYWRPVAGHNHTVHSVLSVFALGGGPKDLQRAYDDDDLHQEPFPTVNQHVIQTLKDPTQFLANMRQLDQYGNYLYHFEREIEARGWKAIVGDYCFSRTPVAEAMLAQLFDGAYHPFIHLGFGIEFDQASIVAEGLAHAATHDPANIEAFFVRSERLARSGHVPAKQLRELYNDVRANEKIRTAARMQEGPVRVRDGVMTRAMDEIVAVAAQYQVSPENLERSVAEMISCAAFSAGAAQRPGKTCKIDFFYMHNVTSSLFVTLLAQQSWIGIHDRVRLLEWKARMDLVWYAASSAPELRVEYVAEYQPTLSKGMDWRALYRAVNESHDDGHVAKFVRALRNGEQVAKPFEQGDGVASFPILGDLWFKLAQMAYDTTTGLPDISKWIMGAGFDPLWAKIPDARA